MDDLVKWLRARLWGRTKTATPAPVEGGGLVIHHLDPDGTLSREMVDNEATNWKLSLSPGCKYLILFGPRKRMLEFGIAESPDQPAVLRPRSRNLIVRDLEAQADRDRRLALYASIWGS